MENKTSTFKFKTNIHCGGCIAAVGPLLDNAMGAKNWQVDITDPNKILTVQAKVNEQEVIKEIVQKAGFTIEEVEDY